MKVSDTKERPFYLTNWERKCQPIIKQDIYHSKLKPPYPLTPSH